MSRIHGGKKSTQDSYSLPQPANRTQIQISLNFNKTATCGMEKEKKRQTAQKTYSKNSFKSNSYGAKDAKQKPIATQRDLFEASFTITSSKLKAKNWWKHSIPTWSDFIGFQKKQRKPL